MDHAVPEAKCLDALTVGLQNVFVACSRRRRAGFKQRRSRSTRHQQRRRSLRRPHPRRRPERRQHRRRRQRLRLRPRQRRLGRVQLGLGRPRSLMR